MESKSSIDEPAPSRLFYTRIALIISTIGHRKAVAPTHHTCQEYLQTTIILINITFGWHN